MFDEKESDEKIIAVCQNDPNMNSYKDISELPKHYFDEITHFFNVYKTLEGKETVVTEVLGRESAEQIIEEKGFMNEYWEWRKSNRDITKNRLMRDFLSEVKGYCFDS